MPLPIKAVEGVELELHPDRPMARARVTRPGAERALSWDRFVRLQAAARRVRALAMDPATILDAGGFDGALALFLPEYTVDVVDPVTTGGTILALPCADRTFDAVIGIDVLEHIEPQHRNHALAEFARVASRHIVLNYPCQDSRDAQVLALQLTNNELIKDHVHWPLPDSAEVMNELAKYGFTGEISGHGNIAVWLSQYVALNLLPDTAQALNEHLVANFADEKQGDGNRSLYHLLSLSRTQ